MDNKVIRKISTSKRTEFHISLKPEPNTSFNEQLNFLKEKYTEVINVFGLTNDDLLCTKVFVSDWQNQKAAMDEHFLFKVILDCGAISIIEQPPVDGTKINLLLRFVKGGGMKKYRKDNAFFAEIGEWLHIFHSVTSCAEHSELEQGTETAFAEHKELLVQHQMNFADHCVRTWLFVKDIDKDYGKVVEGRNVFFSKNGLNLNTHFIASTGIGGSGDTPASSLCVDFYSVKGLKPENVRFLQALDYLNPTYEYGVAFERGVSIADEDIKHVFISGTASIDKHGNCIYIGDVLLQLRRIFVNIEQLLGAAGLALSDMMQIIVYLRDIADYNNVHRYITENFGDIPNVIVQARVCRPKWLIEVECIAAQPVGV